MPPTPWTANAPASISCAVQRAGERSAWIAVIMRSRLESHIRDHDWPPPHRFGVRIRAAVTEAWGFRALACDHVGTLLSRLPRGGETPSAAVTSDVFPVGVGPSGSVLSANSWTRPPVRNRRSRRGEEHCPLHSIVYGFGEWRKPETGRLVSMGVESVSRIAERSNVSQRTEIFCLDDQL